MRRLSKLSSGEKPPPRSPPEENGVVQFEVWLRGISPMIWRRLRVPSACTPREMHGISHQIADAMEHAVQAAYPTAEVIVHEEPAGIIDERLDDGVRQSG